jgi:hypothetical protein
MGDYPIVAGDFALALDPPDDPSRHRVQRQHSSEDAHRQIAPVVPARDVSGFVQQYVLEFLGLKLARQAFGQNHGWVEESDRVWGYDFTGKSKFRDPIHWWKRLRSDDSPVLQAAQMEIAAGDLENAIR